MSESNQNLKLVPNNKLYKFEKISISSPTLPNFIRKIIHRENVYCVLKRKSDSNNQFISYKVKVFRPILTLVFSASNQKPKFRQAGKFFWIEFRLTENGCYQTKSQMFLYKTKWKTKQKFFSLFIIL